MRTHSAPVLLFLVALLASACDDRTEPIRTDEDANIAAEPERDSIVDLLPGEDRYKLAHIDIGALAISLDTIEASGDGSTVILQIGNTTGAGLEDLAATLQWGPLGSDGTPQTSPERTREVPLADSIPAGKWTRATFTLADVPPGELRFLRLTNTDYARLILK
jgi:hypothetical protein